MEPALNSANPILSAAVRAPYDQMRAEHVLPAAAELEEWVNGQIDALEQSAEPTWEGVMVALEEIDVHTHRFASRSGHLHAVLSNEEIRDVGENVHHNASFVEL